MMLLIDMGGAPDMRVQGRLPLQRERMKFSREQFSECPVSTTPKSGLVQVPTSPYGAFVLIRKRHHFLKTPY